MSRGLRTYGSDRSSAHCRSSMKYQLVRYFEDFDYVTERLATVLLRVLVGLTFSVHGFVDQSCLKREVVISIGLHQMSTFKCQFGVDERGCECSLLRQISTCLFRASWIDEALCCFPITLLRVCLCCRSLDQTKMCYVAPTLAQISVVLNPISVGQTNVRRLHARRGF